jgi:DNA-binding response OmpR family regulator
MQSLATAHGVRVLIAEDNVDVAHSLDILLRLFGHQTHVVHDGQAALDAAIPFRPQAAFLDIRMPKVHGAEVARRLRAQPGLDRILIIALSATDSTDPQLNGYNGVFDHYFPKPYNVEDLQAILAAHAGSLK